ATGVSTGSLFLGGILPGILIGVCLMIYAVIYCHRKGEDRERITGAIKELKSKGLGHLFIDSLPALLCPVIVLGGIYAGFVTPTEAACISVFYALIVSLFVYRSIKFKDILGILATAVRTYGGLAFVLAFATAFGRVLSLTGASAAITNFLTSTFDSAWAVLTVCMILFLILGMVMDTGPAIIILAPILLPAMQALGVDPVHFGVILVCCLAIGLATPPFGLNLFVIGNISEEQPMSIARRAVPFIIAFIIALLLIVYVPWFSTFLYTTVA
ncbi:MAG: TRAP transporter large permease, partial [Eggerthellaceae bacterium]